MGVLVTGGAGYIGSVAVERLAAAGETVVVLDNLSTGHRAAVCPGADFVEGDIRDAALVRTLLARRAIDTVMHFAAFSLVGESCTAPLKYFDNNVAGAHALLGAIIEAKTPRFILSSTAAIYGNPDTIPITEDMSARPLNPYGLSKRMIEQMLDWHDRAYGLRYVSLRYFNAAGASAAYGEAHNPETHLIPNVLAAAAGTVAHVTVLGTDYATPDGTCVRDYIHVTDLAGAHLKAMDYLRAGGKSDIFNLGNAAGHSVREVIEAAKRVTQREISLVLGPRRPGDADKLVASSEKAQRCLGWTPEKGSIDEIVRDAWTWRLTHPGAYGS